MINHYAVLGCHPMLTDHEVRTKYRALARQHHPDRPGGSSDAFAQVTAAYAAIGTAKARLGLRGLYALHCPACPACSGNGYSQQNKGFTSVVYAPCPDCGGCGYVLEKAAKVKSYRRQR